MPRPDWHAYFAQLAEVARSRASCPRLAVGAVLVDADRQVLSTGYNGAPRGFADCATVGCHLVDGHCLRAVHAEANAVAQAARRGAALRGATAYLSHQPCYGCLQLLLQAGVRGVVYARPFENVQPGWALLAAEAARAGFIRIEHRPFPPPFELP